MSTEQAGGGGDGVAVADSPHNSNGTTSNGESQRPISPKSLFGNSAETPKEKLKTPNGEQKSTDEAMEVGKSKDEPKEKEVGPSDAQKDVQEKTKKDGDQLMEDTTEKEEAKKEQAEEVVDSKPEEKDEEVSEVQKEEAVAEEADAELKADDTKEEEEIEEPSADLQQDESEKTKEDEQEEQQQKEEEEQPVASSRPRRSTAKSAATTPKTPARSAKTTPAVKAAAKSASKSAAKEVEEVRESSDTQTGDTPRRSTRSTRSKAAAEEAPATPVDKTPPAITPRAGPRSAARRKSVVIVENEEEEEEEDQRKVTPPPAPNAEPNGRTPKTTGQVRKSKAAPKSAARSSTGKGRGRQSEPAFNPDPEDPFNFDSHSNDHPKPFGVLKGDFGSMKFVRSPEVSQSLENRYAKTEQAASRNSTQTTLTAVTANTSTTSLSALSTTPSARKDLGTPASKRGGRKTKADVFTPSAPKNQTPSRRKKHGESDVDLLPKQPKPEIKRPQLSPFEQKGVDFVSHEPYPQGMRVFALWGREFYPAFIFDRDALGRYKVIFAEDEQNKDVPGTGIIPLNKVTKGKQVAVITKSDHGEMETPVEVLHVPSPDDAEEWASGEYEIREAENEEAEIQRVPWTKLLITKLQQKDVMAVKNIVVEVATDNVVPRSPRRSRVAATNAIHEQQHPSQTAKSTPSSQRSAKSAASSAVSQTPRTPTRTPVKRPRAERSEESESPKAKRKAGGSKAAEKPAEEPIPEEDEEQMDEEQMEIHQEQQQVAEEEQMGSEEETDEKNLFSGFYFMLTSSARRATSVTQFNKRECKLAIEERGGLVFEEIDEILKRPEGAKAFVVADTYYRTHKYLVALAASIPTVHHRWIEECLKEKKFLNYEPFLLAAGSSVLDGKEYPWKPLKGELLKDKVIFVHSVPAVAVQNSMVPFANIWHPILTTLGAKVILCNSTEEDQVIEFMDNNHFDVMLTDSSCRPRIIAHAEAKGCQAVSSNWVIQSIVTAKVANVADHPSFSPLV